MKNNSISIQLQFLNKIEDIIPSNSSLVYELESSLGISMDSAYRRIRGETSLTINDVIILCNKYKISFDSFSNFETGTVTFGYTVMKNFEDNFEDYLKSLLKDLTIIKAAKNSQIIYACQDIPVFHNYKYPEMAAFKMFYWMRSIMNVPSLQDKKFDIVNIPDKLKELGKQIFIAYTSIPSIEIWTDSTFQSTLKQIEFYWESGMFNSIEDVKNVCASLKLQLIDIQKQAEISKKYASEDKIVADENNYSLYFSEIEITNNCVLVSLGNTKAVYLGHQSFNTMSTSNISYCNETEIWLNNLIKKSTLISGVAEKHRYQFFRKAFRGLDNLLEKIEEF
ncbi:MAG: hypothetical protein HN704_16995 [Bacteroidetes bacterium]|jgi:hypothetical protein|nr:hypothetical protein [Bacteroidota bacterium]MBT6687714.1 hypothetical protein [Bacteroidota bacterium]MBT7143692.1 hypothetical protein [Bacteroidota bacterium]MBT7493298.1 hypothetical protein [Bacteroidota bacterium]